MEYLKKFENMETKSVQPVQVWVSISGDYCAFHEMSFRIEYDITNDIKLGDLTLRQLERKRSSDYTDYGKKFAYLIDGQYYIKW